MNNEFVEKYSNLIYSITHSFEGYPYKEDLYQSGYIGLAMAYQNYKEEYGVKFSTYAYMYIWGEMNKLVREDKGIKISKSILTLHDKIEAKRYTLLQELMREPTKEELAQSLDIPLSALEEALAIQNPISLDTPIETGEKEMFLSDVVSKREMAIDDLIAFKEELQNLSPQEKDLIEKRFIEAKSQSEVADLYGMNQVQVSRFEKKVKEKIKTKWAA